MKLKRYNSLYEMAFEQEKYENKYIRPNMMGFITHIIKIKLSDPLFGDIIFKGISSFAEKYKNKWEKDAISYLLTIFKNFNKYKVKKPGSIERAFFSQIENMNGEYNYMDLVRILQEVLDEHPKYRFFKHKIKKYFDSPENHITTKDWFLKTLEFLQNIFNTEKWKNDDAFIQNECKNFIKKEIK